MSQSTILSSKTQQPGVGLPIWRAGHVNLCTALFWLGWAGRISIRRPSDESRAPSQNPLPSSLPSLQRARPLHAQQHIRNSSHDHTNVCSLSFSDLDSPQKPLILAAPSKRSVLVLPLVPATELAHFLDSIRHQSPRPIRRGNWASKYKPSSKFCACK